MMNEVMTREIEALLDDDEQLLDSFALKQVTAGAVFWVLVFIPVNFVLYYLRKQARCILTNRRLFVYSSAQKKMESEFPLQDIRDITQSFLFRRVYALTAAGKTALPNVGQPDALAAALTQALAALPPPSTPTDAEDAEQDAGQPEQDTRPPPT